MIKMPAILTGCVLFLFSLSSMAVIDEPPEVRFVVKKFIVTGDNPLPEDITQNTLNKYLGEHYGLEGLRAAADDLEQQLRKRDFAFYRVVLVPQKLEDGVIRFEITEFKIDKVSVEGNKYFSDGNILQNVPGLQSGIVPDANRLSRSIEMANMKPSKNLKLQFFEGEKGGTVNAKVVVEDKKPEFFFVSLNNTGNDETGDFRLTGGFMHTNLFNKDHSAAATYTFSPDESGAVSQYGFTYEIPFYRAGGILSFIASKSDVDSGLVADLFEVSGAGTIVGVNYKHKFLKLGSYKHNVDVSFFSKQFDNNVDFSGIPIAGSGEVTTRPLTLSYSGSHLSTSNNIGFTLSFSSNISGGSNNEDVDYDNLRAGATADWSKSNYAFSYAYFIAQGWIAQLRAAGQETSDLLMSGEQFGIGGIGSVRGYDDRSILGDSGYHASLELWMPAFSEYEIRPLVFVDAGHVERTDPGFGINPEEDPASYGAGIRWSSKQKISFVLDVATTTKDVGNPAASDFVEKGETRAHLDFFYRF